MTLAHLNELGPFAGEAQAMKLAGLSDEVILALARRRSAGEPVLSSAKAAGLRNAALTNAQILDDVNRGMTDAQADAIIAQHERAGMAATASSARPALSAVGSALTPTTPGVPSELQPRHHSSKLLRDPHGEKQEMRKDRHGYCLALLAAVPVCARTQSGCAADSYCGSRQGIAPQAHFPRTICRQPDNTMIKETVWFLNVSVASENAEAVAKGNGQWCITGMDVLDVNGEYRATLDGNSLDVLVFLKNGKVKKEHFEIIDHKWRGLSKL